MIKAKVDAEFGEIKAKIKQRAENFPIAEPSEINNRRFTQLIQTVFKQYKMLNKRKGIHTRGYLSLKIVLQISKTRFQYLKSSIGQVAYDPRDDNMASEEDKRLTFLELLQGLEPLLLEEEEGIRRQIMMKYQILAEREKELREQEEEKLRKQEEERRKAEEAKKPKPVATTVDTSVPAIITPVAPGAPISLNQQPLALKGDHLDDLENAPPPAYPKLDAGLPSYPNNAPINQVPVNGVPVLPVHPAPAKPSNFAVKEVTGDGSCAFRSLVQGLAGGKLSQPEETRQAKILRLEVCRLLVQDRKELLNKEIGLTVEQLIAMDLDTKHSSFESYVEAMGKSAYAGEVEFLLLSKHKRWKITAFKREGRGSSQLQMVQTYGEGLKAPNASIDLIWEKGITEAGNHYNLLLQQ
eukprot:maker-scaffold_12-snap-gene-6.38-mRNA-1 protein AED:0.00 eAED:0.00 QI:64/0/0.5/1/1/1/2/308/409